MIITGVLIGCSGNHLILKDNNSLELCQCLPLPNCVSSNSWVFFNSVAPFEPAASADKAWSIVFDFGVNYRRVENLRRDLIKKGIIR